MKTCSKCKVEKELSEFGKNKANKDGLNGRCKRCVKTYNVAYNVSYKKANKEKLKVYNDSYNEANKDRVKAWNEANKDRVNERLKKRRKEDHLYKLSGNLRSVIQKSFNKKGWKKNTKSQKILGCSFKELEIHLNNNLYGFTIGDSGLDLDHIIPMARATTEEEILKLNHYTNFQLLPSVYNREVKRDNVWDRDCFENWLSLNS